MEKCFRLLFFVLFLLSIVLGSSSKDDEKKSKMKRKAHSYALKALEKGEHEEKTGKDDKVSKKAAKLLQKFQMKSEKKKVKKEVSGKHTEKAMNRAAAARTASLAASTTIRLPDQNGKVVEVPIHTILTSSQTSSPLITVVASNGQMTQIPTKLARRSAMKTVRHLHRQAEAEEEQELVQNASLSGKDMDKLIDVIFRKVFHDHGKIAQKKAFSRVENRMGLKDGTLYKQYISGVEVPIIPSQISSNKNVFAVFLSFFFTPLFFLKFIEFGT
jgi:hypothetical protein